MRNIWHIRSHWTLFPASFLIGRPRSWSRSKDQRDGKPAAKGHKEGEKNGNTNAKVGFAFTTVRLLAGAIHAAISRYARICVNKIRYRSASVNPLPTFPSRAALIALRFPHQPSFSLCWHLHLHYDPTDVSSAGRLLGGYYPRFLWSPRLPTLFGCSFHPFLQCEMAQEG